ncbi:MAG: cation:proton antiporter [Prevotella sp.]|nr:cation:proton antiporter [Prevotella sp.]
MSELEPLIADLALILICAGAMTLLFKRLKQPVVLGYIVAGFLASPNMSYMPSVTDLHGVHLWSEIGVIFLLFSHGLQRQGDMLEKTFNDNLNQREQKE